MDALEDIESEKYLKLQQKLEAIENEEQNWRKAGEEQLKIQKGDSRIWEGVKIK